MVTDEGGLWHEDREGMENVVLSYFTSLFTSNDATRLEEVLYNITPLVTEDMNVELERPISDDEVRCFKCTLLRLWGLMA